MRGCFACKDAHKIDAGRIHSAVIKANSNPGLFCAAGSRMIDAASAGIILKKERQMIQLSGQKTIIDNNSILDEEEAAARKIDVEAARDNTLAWRILSDHAKKTDGGKVQVSFDMLASHDITYVGIIQSARAAGLTKFPLPYILTNCHNSLCAFGGTINEDDHVFGLAACQKYGGIFVPPHCAVIHQFMREMKASTGGMVLGSDSHTRYGTLGCMGVGEGGGELVRQLLGKTWNIDRPEVVAVWLEGEPNPGVGPQDVALAIIGAVFRDGFVKNKIMEFMGPGIAGLSMDYRAGIDIMTTETACLSSIWPTDEKVEVWMEKHGRKGDFAPLGVEGPATYDGLVRVDLSTIEPMIALPFHPANIYTIRELAAHADEILGEIDNEAVRLFGELGKALDLRSKIKDGAIVADQGIIAGCAGGTFENISWASAILSDFSAVNPKFTFSLYPASVPVASALINNGATEKLMSLGAMVQTAFCGPCFGAAETPAHGSLSLRHTTRNFPNREGSKPGQGQLAAVALMDARSIAATAANGGRLRPATELDWKNNSSLKANLDYNFNPTFYKKRVYNGFGEPRPDTPLIFGPNISDWPVIEKLPEHLILLVAAVIDDPVTTTDELIPSGEISSLRSNPQKLAEYTLSRKDPQYVGRAKQMLEMEKRRLANPDDPELLAKARELMGLCQNDTRVDEMNAQVKDLRNVGFGSLIFAIRPGDGSAREQAASSQKILGGWANLAVEYATKRYRSNLINWGIIPFTVKEELGKALKPGDHFILPYVRSAIAEGQDYMLSALIHEQGGKTWSEQIGLALHNLSQEEREIILSGCLINYYNNEK